MDTKRAYVEVEIKNKLKHAFFFAMLCPPHKLKSKKK